MKCLFCESDGPFTTVEHVIPESLGNDVLVLTNDVCDSCQNYFGKEIEKFVLEKTPIAFWRVYLRIRTKTAQNPHVDMRQPKQQKGVLPNVHVLHDNIGFAAHDDGSVSVDMHDDDLVRQILSGEKSQFVQVFTPNVLFQFGRFLCKIGIELLCTESPNRAREPDLNKARRFARFGEPFRHLWPIFHFNNGKMPKVAEETEIECYSYSMVEVSGHYLVFRFGMGTDNWLVCVNDASPNLDIQALFPSESVNCIWYHESEYAGK
ncbi:MAG: hypothetical protein IID30_10260 [Planctomycetes bacterium]|nr:hypothetical protein [Planctomycetota bacterium]